MKIYLKRTNKLMLFLIFAYFAFVGCEEIIEVELDDASPQIVIEAEVSQNPEFNKVTITKSTDFFNPGEYEKISDAQIVVTEINGASYTFLEISPGNYTNKNLVAKVGSEYSITVSVEGKTFTATSTLPKPLVLDSMAVIGEKRPFQDELDYEYHVYFQDNPGIGDYARFRLYINGIEKGGIFRYDDRLTDGRYIDFWRFFINPDEKVKPGDVVEIEMLTIDKASFEYFDTLRRALATSTGGPFGPSAPSNPVTNWDNGALGYFSVYSLDSQSVVIK